MTDNNKKLEMPQAESDGFFVPTLNNQGFMGSYPSDPYMKEFIEFSVEAPGPVLDIGAAYGVACLEALKAGAKVIANDIDPKHLQILRDRTPEDLRPNLELKPGSFPADLKLSPNSLGAVLIARVLHFFSGDEIINALATVYAWLTPGGRLYVTAETPYLKNIQSFIPIYEERVAKAEKWPGYIEDFSKIDQRQAYNLPSRMHFLDPQVLKRSAEEVGFEVLQCQTFGRSEFPESLQLDGRESVGLIAVKN